MVWGAGHLLLFCACLHKVFFFVKLEFYNLLFCNQLQYGGCTFGMCGMGGLGHTFFCAVPLPLLPLMPYHHFIIIFRIHSPHVMFQPHCSDKLVVLRVFMHHVCIIFLPILSCHCCHCIPHLHHLCLPPRRCMGPCAPYCLSLSLLVHRY